MKIIFELPFYSNTCGGVLSTIALAKSMNAEIRFQSIQRLYPESLPVPFTVGKADEYFPPCDVAISYSDNPYLYKLCNLSQVKRVAVFMQSYGMSIANEKTNALNSKILVLCTTKKIEKAIQKDGGKVHNVGFGLTMNDFTNLNAERKNYLAIMYHDMESKKYATAVKVADLLYNAEIIEGVISFGVREGYANAPKPKGLVKHYMNATHEQVSEVFNLCKAFLMPSVSEGLNLTPVESTLCGCPAILCDGAINELFFDEENCFIAEKANISEMAELCTDAISNFDVYSKMFESLMKNTISGMTWDKVAEKIKDLIYA